MTKETIGFTIVELIIVISVIAILAGITIVSYGSWRTTTAQNTVKSDLNGVASAMESARTFNNGYPASIPTTFSSSPDVSLDYARGDTNSYCITATSVAVSSVSYYIDSLQGSTVQQGVCPGIITNLIANPSVENGSTSPNSTYYSPTMTVDATKSAFGTQSLKVLTNSTTQPQGVIWIAPNAMPNVQYTCSVSVTGTVGKVIAVAGRAATSGSAYIGEGYGAKNVTLSASWQRVSITFTSPANTGILYLQYHLNTAESGITIWGDGAMCVQSATGNNYSDGDSLGWTWNGATSNSASTGPGL